MEYLGELTAAQWRSVGFGVEEVPEPEPHPLKGRRATDGKEMVAVERWRETSAARRHRAAVARSDFFEQLRDLQRRAGQWELANDELLHARRELLEDAAAGDGSVYRLGADSTLRRDFQRLALAEGSLAAAAQAKGQALAVEALRSMVRSAEAVDKAFGEQARAETAAQEARLEAEGHERRAALARKAGDRLEHDAGVLRERRREALGRCREAEGELEQRLGGVDELLAAIEGLRLLRDGLRGEVAGLEAEARAGERVLERVQARVRAQRRLLLPSPGPVQYSPAVPVQPRRGFEPERRSA